MALRKHRPGELVIEQTRDLARVREILASAGMMTDGIEWPAACYILAYNGDVEEHREGRKSLVRMVP